MEGVNGGEEQSGREKRREKRGGRERDWERGSQFPRRVRPCHSVAQSKAAIPRGIHYP